MPKMISTEEMVLELGNPELQLPTLDRKFVDGLRVLACKGEMYTQNSDTLEYLDQLYERHCL